MDRFSKSHPVVLFLYYLLALLVVLSFNNPFISAASLFGAAVYAFVRTGRKALKTVLFSIAVIAVVSLFNMLFAHYGNDVLFSLNSTDFTLEALFYGFHQGIVLSAAVLWFAALSYSLDSEKTVYLFRFAPKLALLFSMVLGFIPRFLKKQQEIREARLALNGGEAPTGAKSKLQAAAGDLSALTSYALEGSIITANSMAARGYRPGVIRRGRFQVKTVDIIVLSLFLLLFAFVLLQKLTGNLSFVFEPDIYIKRLSIPAVACFLLYSLMPSMLDLWENVLWRLSSLKT